MKRFLQKEASDLRSTFGFGSRESIHLQSLLIKQNILTIFRQLSENFSGMAVKTGEHRFMLINSNHSTGRQNFTICHELYHLYIDQNFSPHHCSSGLFNRKDPNEYSADLFASYFLLPEDGIINLIPGAELIKDKITLETILKIEHYFSCSRTALLYRLKEIGFISSDKYDTYNSKIKFHAVQYGYPVSLYEKGNERLVLGEYGTLAKQLFDSEKISEGRYATLMEAIGIDVLKEDDNAC
jgi:Zn-dependent peptidase ImmA (M78 family)